MALHGSVLGIPVGLRHRSVLTRVLVQRAPHPFLHKFSEPGAATELWKARSLCRTELGQQLCLSLTCRRTLRKYSGHWGRYAFLHG